MADTISPRLVWIGSFGTTYGLFLEPSTWPEASTSAQTYGAHLVKVDTTDENVQIFSSLNDFFRINESLLDQSRALTAGNAAHLWMGGSDQVVEGQWRWSFDNSPISTVRSEWGRGSLGVEPNNANGNQHYLALGLENWPRGFDTGRGLGSAGQWNDLDAEQKLFFLAEKSGSVPQSFNTQEDQFFVSLVSDAAFSLAIPSSSVSLERLENSAAWQLTSIEYGTDIIAGFSKVRFTDKTAALDFSADSLTYQALKFTAATFGMASIDSVFPVVLQVLESGKSLSQAIALAVNSGAIESTAASKSVSWASLIYSNVYGQPPSSQTEEEIMAAINNRSLSKAEALAIAMEIPELTEQINLAGLQSTGLFYNELA